MNYLAHAYLSFNRPGILAGNMISDHVKGNKQYEYALPIQKGIQLHRAIDNFTDSHSCIKEMKKVFKPAYGLYAGAFVDIVCDYFLANDRYEFSSEQMLVQFTQHTYDLIEKQISILPPAFQAIFGYMKQYDWLANYRFEWGIQKSFAGIVRRAKYMDESDTAFELFQNNIETLGPFYIEFFPLLKKFSIHTLEELSNFD